MRYYDPLSQVKRGGENFPTTYGLSQVRIVPCLFKMEESEYFASFLGPSDG